MTKIIGLALGLVMSFTSRVLANELVRSLPSEAQAKVLDVRKACHDFYGKESDKYLTNGDDGLIVFFVSGTMAVLIDELRLCGSGYECIKGVNCATGFTHEVMIYVLSKGSWKKALSVTASEPILLSVDENRFKLLVMRVFAAWGCPPATKMGTKNMCTAAVRWDGAKFTFTLLSNF